MYTDLTLKGKRPLDRESLDFDCFEKLLMFSRGFVLTSFVYEFTEFKISTSSSLPSFFVLLAFYFTYYSRKDSVLIYDDSIS